MTSLNIVCLDKTEYVPDRIKNINLLLPKPPFRWSIVGASGSGKTNMICNLFRKGFYKDVFKRNHIFVMSSTADIDDKLKLIPTDNYYTTFNVDVFHEIFEEQEAIKKEYGKRRMDHICLIIDDLMHDRGLKNSGLLSDYIFRARHFNISIITSVQKFTGLSRTIRLNSNFISIFRCGLNERDFIADEYADKSNKKQFKQILNEVFEEPFNFLHICCEEPNLTKRYRKNFEEILEFNISV